MQRFDDVRRFVAGRTLGLYRYLLTAEGHLVDLEGAVGAGNADYAAFAARRYVLSLLSVVSAGSTGALVADEYHPSFDWFEGVDDDLVDRALALAAEPLAAPMSPDELPAWLERVRGLAVEVEAVLALEEPLPRLRSADGMFGGLSAARRWIEVCVELGVPLPAVSSS